MKKVLIAYLVLHTFIFSNNMESFINDMLADVDACIDDHFGDIDIIYKEWLADPTPFDCIGVMNSKEVAMCCTRTLALSPEMKEKLLDFEVLRNMSMATSSSTDDDSKCNVDNAMAPMALPPSPTSPTSASASASTIPINTKPMKLMKVSKRPS